jgi:putative transposase
MTPRELIALADGIRESSESWADLLRSCKRRGMRAPVCRALRAVFPQTGEQHWIHLRINLRESAFAAVRL